MLVGKLHGRPLQGMGKQVQRVVLHSEFVEHGHRVPKGARNCRALVTQMHLGRVPSAGIASLASLMRRSKKKPYLALFVLPTSALPLLILSSSCNNAPYLTPETLPKKEKI